MLMPALSVTAIGVLIAVVGIIALRLPAAGTLVRGLAGAWIGFLVGVLPGALLDVVLTAGIYIPLVGHVCAAVGAALTVAAWRAARADRSTSTSHG